MMFVRWFALAAVAVLSSPVTAGVVLTRSDKAVVLENELVRVELHRDRNFHPSILVDRRNPKASLVDEIGFIAWKLFFRPVNLRVFLPQAVVHSAC